MVYGTDVKQCLDEFGNSIMIINNPYEATLFHFRKTAEQKTFYGNNIRIKHYNTKFATCDN